MRLCAHLLTRWSVMTSCVAGRVLAGPAAGAGCCLTRPLWGSTLCQGSHILCPTSGSHSAVVPGIVSVGDRASLPFLCWAPGRVWRAPQRRAGPCFCGCWVWCCLGFHWRRDRLGSLPSLPSSLQPCRLLSLGGPPTPSPGLTWLPSAPRPPETKPPHPIMAGQGPRVTRGSRGQLLGGYLQLDCKKHNYPDPQPEG